MAVLCGFTLAIVNFLKILLFDGFIMGNEDITVAITAVICITLVLTVF